MAVDKYGLVHLAIISVQSESSAILNYQRQVQQDGGGTKWMSDTIDPEVFGGEGTIYAAVDMVVDDNARPHIAYFSGLDNKVHYATRYDR